MSLKVKPANPSVRFRIKRTSEAMKVRAERRASYSVIPDSRSKEGKKRFTAESRQDLEISGLKHELSQVRKLLDMVLCMVDPEDVRAALELPRITPPNEKLLEIADRCMPPEDALADEERPW